MLKAYYFVYYTFYKLWSKNHNPFLSTCFQADISMIAVEIWLLGVIDSYISIILNQDITEISIKSPKVIIVLVLIISSTLYFLTFSNNWKPYFKEFEKWPKRKRRIRIFIVWAIIAFIFANLIFSVELMRRSTGG